MIQIYNEVIIEFIEKILKKLQEGGTISKNEICICLNIHQNNFDGMDMDKVYYDFNKLLEIRINKSF